MYAHKIFEIRNIFWKEVVQMEIFIFSARNIVVIRTSSYYKSCGIMRHAK